MEPSSVFTLDGTTVVSLFALAWFIVGIVVGRVMPKRRFSMPRRQRHSESRRRSEGGDIELYVGNLAYEVSDHDLNKMFDPFGKVVSARIIQNRFNNKSKGYGFVEMANRDQALAAIRALNGKDIKGRRIVVNEAKSSAHDR